jgi:methionine synthase I (cobalamin-dependent)
MAGALTISTLKNDTGVLAVQNGMTGIAKAWANFNGGRGNTAGVINGSFNVSSITVNGTGDYTVNYTTAMPNINYAIALQSVGADAFSVQGIYDTTTTTTTAIRIQNRNLSSGTQNPIWMSVTINGA